MSQSRRSSITESNWNAGQIVLGWRSWRRAGVIPTVDSSTSPPGSPTRNTASLVAPTPSQAPLSNGAKIHSQDTALLGKPAYSSFFFFNRVGFKWRQISGLTQVKPINNCCNKTLMLLNFTNLSAFIRWLHRPDEYNTQTCTEAFAEEAFD